VRGYRGKDKNFSPPSSIQHLNNSEYNSPYRRGSGEVIWGSANLQVCMRGYILFCLVEIKLKLYTPLIFPEI